LLDLSSFFCYKILRVFLKGEEKSEKAPLKFSFGKKGGVTPKQAWEANIIGKDP